MSDIQLYINNKLANLSIETVVAITKQINNFGELDSRQSTFSNTINLPRTYNNLQIFKNIGFVGIFDKLPYRKVSVKLRANGFCIIKNVIGLL